MPAYHSIFLEEPNQQLIACIPKFARMAMAEDEGLTFVGNFALLPLRTRTRGPAPTLSPLAAGETPLTIDAAHQSYDIVDEILSLFRANTFFRNFEIKGPADRGLIYGILFTSQLLLVVKPNMPRREAEKQMLNLSLDTNFKMPGDAGFPLNQAFEAPRDRQQAELLRQYIGQMRQELAVRLLDRLYMEDPNSPSKWWLSYNKRKFMGKAL